MYDIRFDEDAKNAYINADNRLAGKLNRCFERLAENPFIHPNIAVPARPLPRSAVRAGTGWQASRCEAGSIRTGTEWSGTQ